MLRWYSLFSVRNYQQILYVNSHNPVFFRSFKLCVSKIQFYFIDYLIDYTHAYPHSTPSTEIMFDRDFYLNRFRIWPILANNRPVWLNIYRSDTGHLDRVTSYKLYTVDCLWFFTCFKYFDMSSIMFLGVMVLLNQIEFGSLAEKTRDQFSNRQ